MNRTSLRRQPQRLAWAWVIALALVAAQVLGLAHTLAHSTPAASIAASIAVTNGCAGDAEGDGSRVVADDHDDDYGHARGTQTCALWLGVVGAPALVAEAAVAPVLEAATPGPVPRAIADTPRDSPRAFDARGPPRA
jgi:hypothetical protein